jgi:hypothetical protein
LVLPFELLKLNPTEFGAKLGAFAGISIPPDINSIRRNERVSETYVVLRRAVQKILSPETLRRIWLKTPFSYRRVIKSLALKGGRFDRQISVDQEDLLRTFFGAGNDRLSRRYDLQLAERFGYLTQAVWQQSPAMQPDLMELPEAVRPGISHSGMSGIAFKPRTEGWGSRVPPGRAIATFLQPLPSPAATFAGGPRWRASNGM